MLYTVDGALITDRPEIRILDKVYKVDDRMATFERMNRALASAANEVSEFDIVIAHGLSEAALEEIRGMELSFAATHKIVVLITAAMQGISEEEAERRFQSANGQKQ